LRRRPKLTGSDEYRIAGIPVSNPGRGCLSNCQLAGWSTWSSGGHAAGNGGHRLSDYGIASRSILRTPASDCDEGDVCG